MCPQGFHPPGQSPSGAFAQQHITRGEMTVAQEVKPLGSREQLVAGQPQPHGVKPTGDEKQRPPKLRLVIAEKHEVVTVADIARGQMISYHQTV